jgi:cephalosporin-C deacetylase-like acetyl esterase
MKRHLRGAAVVALMWLVCPQRSAAENEEFLKLQAHFERVLTERFDNLLSGVGSVKEWEARKQASRQALATMLWHERSWTASPPPVRITRRQERAAYTLENLILETAPGVYSTANLYLPREGRKPFPVILYQCGHANKSVYKHHGAWFAARGIAVLMMDNIEMGEIQFTHHGVYSHAWFHWYSRGFSPLAAELLNARRAVDYLVAREDLDAKRIGATGISGGGMTTFFLAAIDDRIKASAPVSGAISTVGWVKQRLSMAHCDCQYPVNSHGLTYSEIGALTAPRTQLLCNADADRGFPMDAFNEMVAKMREVYRLYDANESLRVAVVSGGHADTEAIRLPVYEFFLKEFLGLEVEIESEGPIDTPEDRDLECFLKGYPTDERLTRIDEELAPVQVLSWDGAPVRRAEELARQLRREVFRYFPEQDAPFEATWGEEVTHQGRVIRSVEFNSFEDLRARALYSVPVSAPRTRLPTVLVVDHRKGIPVWGNRQSLEAIQWGNRAVLVVETLDRGSRALEENLRSFRDDDPLHHMRRQAMVAGTTLESMQLYEVLRSLQFLRSQPEVDPAAITIAGQGGDGIHGLYAGLLAGGVARVVLKSPPASHRQGPSYLGVLRYTDIPEVIALMDGRVRLYGEIPLSVQAFLEKAGAGDALVAGSLADCLQ